MEEQQNKVYFKMTFANSWWQCLVAILLYYPFLIVFTILLGLINDSLSGFGILFAIAAVFYVAWWLSYRTWKEKQVHGNDN